MPTLPYLTHGDERALELADLRRYAQELGYEDDDAMCAALDFPMDAVEQFGPRLLYLAGVVLREHAQLKVDAS